MSLRPHTGEHFEKGKIEIGAVVNERKFQRWTHSQIQPPCGEF
jgi:hypothetical protein